MTTRRPTLAARLRTTALAAVLAATSFAVTATPATAPATSGSSPFAGIVAIADQLFAPRQALAAFCASNPVFTGRLTASASSTTAVSGITDPDVYAYISNVDADWSCTAYLRYSGVAWNTTASAGRFDWGNLINSTSVGCNYLPGSTDFIKANSTADCPDTDAEYALMATLSAERIYRADMNHDTIGDFSFIHADCGTYYSGTVAGEPIQGDETTPESFAGSNVGNRPGANCDALTIDGTGTTQTITYDKTPPTGTSVSINDGATYTTTPSVTLATAATGGFAALTQMQFTNDNSNWSTPPQAYAASASWTLSGGDGTKTVYARYLDANGNTSAAVSDTIVLDTANPTGSISIAGGAPYTTSSSVTLNLTYADAGSGPYQMQFNNEGGTWSGWEPVAPTKAWTLSPGDGTKTVNYQVKDNAGRTSAYSDTIVLDTANPTGSISIAGGAPYTTSSSVTLNLTYADAGSGPYQMQFNNEGGTWSGWEPVAATRSAWTLSPGDGTKTVNYQVKDNAGRTSAYSDTIVLDTANPTGSISIAGGAPYTTSSSVTLNLTYADAGSGPYQMQFNNEGGTWSGWEPVAATRSAWTLSPGDGTKTVNYQVKDNAGRTSAYSDTIVLDTANPTGSISIAGGAPYTTSSSVTLNLTYADAGSGPYQMQFNNEGGTWSGWQTVAATKAWTLSPGDGTKTVNYEVKDNAGRTSAYSDTIVLDTTGPVASIATPEANLPIAGDLAVTGTAADTTAFGSYTLDFGAGTSPASWTAIQTSTTQVFATGPLGTWSTGALAAGAYTLRLTVRDQAGNPPSVSSHLVYVDNTRRGDEAYYTRVPFDLGGGWGLDVGVATGEARLARSLFSILSYGPAAGLDLAYSSTDFAASSFGYGWHSNLTQSLSFESGFVNWHRADGGQVPFGQAAGTWTPLAGHFERLTAGTGGDAGRYLVTLSDQTKLVFEGSGAGRLLRIENRFGKILSISWGAGTATLTDASGRTSTVTFTGSLITSVLDSAGRTWSFHYNATSDLDAITEPDPDGAASLAAPVTTLGYEASHRLTTVTRHRRTAAGGDDTIVWTVGYTGGKATSVIDPIADADYADVANTFTYNPGSTVVALLKTYSPIVRNNTSYEFDELGRTMTITDPLNHQTTQNWYPDSTLESVVDPNGVKTAYTYTGDGKGNLETETADALGTPVTTRYVYNPSNDVVETHVAEGSAAEVVTKEDYDTAGTGSTPGHVVTVTANAADPDPAKRQVTRYAYAANNQVAASLDPKGVITTHAYDPNGNEFQTVANCTQSAPPANWWDCAPTDLDPHDATTNVTTTSVFTLTATAGKLGLPESVTSVSTGRSTTFSYDTLGRTTTEAPPEGQTTHEWDQLGNEIRTTEPGSLVTTRTMDLMNRATTEVAPLRTTTTTYDATGAVTQRTTASDTVTSTYDGAGRLLTETADPGASPHLNLMTEHAYDASGREVAARNADLTVTRTVYDADGRVTKKVENCTSTGTTTWVANDPGWTTCTGDGTKDATWNLTTTFGYDDRGNKATETAPNLRTTSWTYDDLDRVTRQVDNDVANPTLPTEDVTTEYAYDAAGHQAAVKSPSTGSPSGYRITRSFFDALGRVTRTIENCTDSPVAAWQTCSGTGTHNADTNVETTVTYDADGHRLSVTAPSPAATDGIDLATVTTRYAYDGAGRLCRVLENATVELDGADRCTRSITGTTTSHVSTRYEYDTRGNLARMYATVNGLEQTTAYGYDNTGRMTSIDQPGVATDLTWMYDDGARTKIQTNRSAGTVTWTSDAAGRLALRAYQDPSGNPRTTTYSYTGSNAAWTVTDSAGMIDVTNDRLGRPTSVTVTGDAAATTTYGYSFTASTRTDASGSYTMAVDKSGRLISLTDPIYDATPWTWAYGADGAVTIATMPTTTALTATSTYDALGRLLTRTTTPGPRAAYTQTYNRAGNRLSEASTIPGDPANGTATTAFDPLNRLTSYALPGIRTLGAGFDTVPNRTALTTDGTPVTTTFDAANRPTSGGYLYDADGRMTIRAGSAGTTLSYDSLGRLAEVRQDPGSTLVARYTYDALDRLLVVERTSGRIRFRYAGITTAVAQVVDDTSGTVTRNVTIGPEGTVLQDWSGTDRRLYGVNGHHDTTWTADDAGTVTATLRYDPWGNVIASSGSLPDWRFQASWADTGTNLAWSIARWYDPAQGTFITEDTLLGDTGSPASRHLYAYGAGDPVGSWDPSGALPSLNQFEQAFCDEHRFPDCVWIGYEAQRATDRQLDHFHNLTDGTRSNAFKHCFWAGMCRIGLGAAKARLFTDLHESYVDGRYRDIPRNAAGRIEFWTYEYPNHVMDRHNNAVGIQLAGIIKQHRANSVKQREDEMDDACMGALRQHKLIVLYS